VRVRRVLQSRAIGAPTWARIAFRTGYDVYRTQPYFLTEERLAILDVGIHVLPNPFLETLIEIEGDRRAIVVEAGLTMRVTSDAKMREEKIDAPLLP
jgi:hypothetical protein